MVQNRTPCIWRMNPPSQRRVTTNSAVPRCNICTPARAGLPRREARKFRGAGRARRRRGCANSRWAVLRSARAQRDQGFRRRGKRRPPALRPTRRCQQRGITGHPCPDGGSTATGSRVHSGSFALRFVVATPPPLPPAAQIPRILAPAAWGRPSCRPPNNREPEPQEEPRRFPRVAP